MISTNITDSLNDKTIYINFCKIIFKNNILFFILMSVVYRMSDYVIHVLYMNKMKYLLGKYNVEFSIDMEGEWSRIYLKIIHHSNLIKLI